MAYVAPIGRRPVPLAQTREQLRSDRAATRDAIKSDIRHETALALENRRVAARELIAQRICRPAPTREQREQAAKLGGYDVEGDGHPPRTVCVTLPDPRGGPAVQVQLAVYCAPRRRGS